MRWLLLAVPLWAWGSEYTSVEWRSVGGVPAATPASFRAAGLYCPDGTKVRASVDGRAWTEWLDAGHAEDSGQLVYFGAPQRYLEVSASCRVLLIDAGESTDKPTRTRAADGVEVVKRADWGCTPERCPPRGAPSFTNVTHLVVHHSAGANVSNDWAGVVRSIWVLHVNGNGWNDIGYNYLIDPNGVVYEGRAGGDGVLGAHFSGVNGGTMGVCLIGTYSVIAPADVMMESLKRLLIAQALRWKVDPGGRSLHASSRLMLNNISGHRDAGLSAQASGTTECPGNGVYARLARLREEVRAAVEGECPLKVAKPFVCAGASGGELPVAVEAACPVEMSSTVDWIRVGEKVEVAPHAGSAMRSGVLRINGQAVQVTQAAAGVEALPCVDFQGVVGAAAFDVRPLAPGSLFSLLGADLASGSLEGPAWPVALGGVTVQVNGRAVPLGYVSPGQINAQLPTNVAIGSARVVVTRDGVAGPERLFWVSEAVPGILAVDGAVKAGSTVNVYLTGAGRSGLPWSTNLGKAVALRTAEGLVGVQVAQVELAADLAAGEHDLVVTVAGVTSQPVRVVAE